MWPTEARASINKLDHRILSNKPTANYVTGRVYEWQSPIQFIQMDRRCLVTAASFTKILPTMISFLSAST